MPRPTSSPSGKRRSRRDFLKTSAGLLSSAAVGGLAIARGAHAAGSDVLKVGLIGCGGRGSGAAVNALNASPSNKLVAMAAVFEDKVLGARDRIKKQKGDQVAVADDHCFWGFAAGQKVIQSDVDVVAIACASRFHPIYLTAAVKAGKHVFVEKPAAIDPPGVRMVQAACDEARKKNLSVVSGLCWRYDVGMREMMKRVLDGTIGDIVAIQETYLRTPYRLIERQPEWTEIQYQFRNWYHFTWLSGDDIPQSLVHSLDKGNWAMREQAPLKAYGVGGRSSSFDKPFVYGDVFDHNAVVYEYANGVRMYGVGRAQNGCFGEVSDVFMGTKGRALHVGSRYVIEGQTKWQYDGPKCNMTDEEHVALFTAIRSGKPLVNDYMASSAMLGVLGTLVCYTGQQVTWEDAMKANWRLGPENVAWDMDPPVKPDDKGQYPIPVPGVTKLV